MKDKKTNKSRRRFLKISGFTGVALVIGVYLPNVLFETQDAIFEETNGQFKPNAWLKLFPDNSTTIIVNHSELGQGITTSLPMIIADELDADWSKVSFEMAPVKTIYKNPKLIAQITASSTSITTSWDILRSAGATTRHLLIMAAAKTWKIKIENCTTENGMVFNKLDGTSLQYGQLLKLASQLTPPENVPLKKPEDFRLIGKNLPKLDTVDKVNGTALFGMDIRLPDMLVASIIHPPFLESEVLSINDEKVLKQPGIKSVINLKNAVAVVAESFWQANRASEHLAIRWSDSEFKNIDSEEIEKRRLKLGSTEEGSAVYEKGDIEAVYASKKPDLEATYFLPYQAHAAQEPMNCTAFVQENRCDVWVPTQAQGSSQAIAVKYSGLDDEQVFVHSTYVGGAFGGKISVNYVAEAVQLSKIFKKPVKAVWTREEDMQHDCYRTSNVNKINAILDEQKMPKAWHHTIIGADHLAYMVPRLLPGMLPSWMPGFAKNVSVSLADNVGVKFIPGKGIPPGAGPLMYDIPNLQVSFVEDNPEIPIGFWRSVTYSTNVFVVECFIDELSKFAGSNPLDYRRVLLKKNKRALAVLELAAKKSDWERALPKGMGRGIAFNEFHDSLVALVVELSIDQDKKIKVHRMICAVDCGTVIHPKTIAAQMESSFAFGLSATLKSEITFKSGQVVQKNYNDFPILRFDEMPYVETHLLQNTLPPTGIGEAGVPAVAPAVANAVFNLTGKRLRKLPLRLEG